MQKFELSHEHCLILTSLWVIRATIGGFAKVWVKSQLRTCSDSIDPYLSPQRLDRIIQQRPSFDTYIWETQNRLTSLDVQASSWVSEI